MTLIIAAGNSDQFIQVSDRRLTINGRLYDDESNKAIIVSSADARLSIGFTGLARAGNFDTRRWLLKTISDCGPPDYTAEAVLKRVKNKATDIFQDNVILKNLRQDIKRLSIMVTGYLYNYNPPLGVSALLTNYNNIYSGQISFNAWDHFAIFYGHETRPSDNGFIYINAVGTIPPTDPKLKQKLEFLLKKNKPASAIVDKLIDVFHIMADMPQINGAIGKQLNSIILHMDPELPIQSGYHSDILAYKIFLPDHIYIVSKKLHLTYEVDLFVDPSSSIPISGPGTKPNEPCFCKSGKKYKHCHGKKHKNKYLPLQINVNPNAEKK